MASDRVIRITLIGDSKSAEKALKSTGDAAGTAEVKVDGFGKSFAKMGLAFEAGRMGLDLFARAVSSAVSAVAGYNSSVELSERQLRGMLGSQEEANKALAVARAEADKGRGTYQELAAAMAGLSSVARTAGMDLQSVTEVAQILAAVNPAEGITGATFALREAASGDMTSVIERFNLSRSTINQFRAEGVPAIEAVRLAMQEMGYDTRFLNEVNASTTNQFKIFKGELTELAAIAGEPIFQTLAMALREVNREAQGGDGGMNFAQRLREDLRALLSGNIIDEVALTISKLIVVIADRYNEMIKGLSGGRINFDGLVASWKENVTNFETQLRADIEEHFTQPLADEIGKAAPAVSQAAEQAGGQVAQSFLLGLTGSDLSGAKGFFAQFESFFKDETGKTNTEAFAKAQDLLAQALQEVQANGQMLPATFYKITAAFGDQALNVAGLVTQYGQMTAAQDRAVLSAAELVEQKQREKEALDQLTVRLRDYEGAVNAATAAAKQNAASSADAAEAAQGRLEDVSNAAAASARENAAEIAALQEGAAARAAALAEQEAAAQAELTEIQRRRREEAQALYDEIVAGERRALDAANERLNQLTAKGRKEDLGILRQIQAAEDAGDTKKAAALRRQLETQRKRRRGEEELAAAEAAVARDEFDAEDKRADKEVERLDGRIAKEEEAAAAKLAAIQQTAKEQAVADAAAIKGAQAAAKAEADRYAAQQRGIQAEIDRIQDAAREQARKDQQAIDDATRVYNNQKAINDKLGIQVGFITRFAERQDSAAQRTATATQKIYDTSRDLLPIAIQLAEAMERQADAAERIANTPQTTAPENGGTGSKLRATPNGGWVPSGGGGSENDQLRAGSARREWDRLVRGGSGAVVNG